MSPGCVGGARGTGQVVSADGLAVGKDHCVNGDSARCTGSYYAKVGSSPILAEIQLDRDSLTETKIKTRLNKV